MSKQKAYDGDAFALRCTVAEMARMLRVTPQRLYQLTAEGWFDRASDGTVGVAECLHGFVDSKIFDRPY
jgi:hypothetical protein